MAKGNIIIKRNIAYGRFRRFAIFLDGKKKALIGYNKTISIAVSPGRHTIYARFDWVKSDELQLEITENLSLQLTLATRTVPSRKYWLTLILFAACVAVGATFGPLGGGIGAGIGGIFYMRTIGRPYLEENAKKIQNEKGTEHINQGDGE
jgi:hypothetical protein